MYENPGLGKTALAVHWAHRVAERFPDGQLYIDLRGYGPSGQVVTPAEAIRRFLDALEVRADKIPVDPDAHAALYRSQMASRRMLIVLDNARDSAQARPLLPASPGSLVLVTSRNYLPGLVAADGAHPVDLDLPSMAEARELLARRLGTHRVGAEPGAVAEIIAWCARLPLALALVAARAATKPQMALRVLAGELADVQQRWQILTGDEPHSDVRAVFSWSYQALTPPAAQLFRLLGLCPGPDISAAAAASLAGVQLASSVDTDEQRHHATGRILDHYLHTAHAAALMLDPGRDPIALAPPLAGVTPEQFGDQARAWHWFIDHRPVLLAAVADASAFLDRRGHRRDQVSVAEAVVTAAQRLADPVIQARTHRNLALTYLQLGRLDDAHTHLRHTVDMATRAGDQTQQAHTHYRLAHLWEQRDQPVQALHHARQSLYLFQATGHQTGQADALNAVGWYHTLLGDHEQAITHCQQALVLSQQLDDREGQAATWGSLGHAHRHLGQYTRAITCYQHAVTLGDRYHESAALTYIGDTHQATGNPNAARHAWQQALKLLDDIDHPDATQVRAKLDALKPLADRAGQ